MLRSFLTQKRKRPEERFLNPMRNQARAAVMIAME